MGLKRILPLQKQHNIYAKIFFWEFCSKYKGRPFDLPPLPARADWLDLSTGRRTTGCSRIDTSCRFQVIAHPAHWGKPAIRRRFLKLPRFFGGRRRNGTGLVSSWSADCRWKASAGDITADKQTNKRCHVCGERGESSSRLCSLYSTTAQPRCF